jgi:hypothetical protein
MASLKDYFDTDFNHVLNTSNNFHYTGEGGIVDIPGRLHFDFDANATFISCYISDSSRAAPIIDAIILNLEPFFALSQLAHVKPFPKTDPGNMRESIRPVGPGRIRDEEATWCGTDRRFIA